MCFHCQRRRVMRLVQTLHSPLGDMWTYAILTVWLFCTRILLDSFIKLLIVPSLCPNSASQTFKNIENLTLFYFCEYSVQGCLFYKRTGTLPACVIRALATRKGRLNYWSLNSQHTMLCESLSIPSKCKGPSYLKAFISIYVGLHGVNKCYVFSNSWMFLCYC